MKKTTRIPLIAVQASTVSWTGGADPSFFPIDGKPLVYFTIQHILRFFPNAQVVIVAPEHDKENDLIKLKNDFDNLEVLFGSNDSPLNRLISACAVFEKEYLIRVDGLHFCADMSIAEKMYKRAIERKLDCIKLPDDFPIHYTSDIYSKNGLLKAKSLIEETGEKKYAIHPKYLMFREDQFNVEEYSGFTIYDKKYMLENRKIFQKIRFPRHTVTNKGIKLGDLASYHYEIAARYINPTMDVLDVACGTGYGSHMLARYANRVIGVDIDRELIDTINEADNPYNNLSFEYGNVEQMRFEDTFFDAIISMETIDYVNEALYIKEMHRLLRVKGLFILSTQQNRKGFISVNSVSEEGYTLEKLKAALNPYFSVLKVYSFKAGRIYFDDDLIGRSLMLVCNKL